MNLLRKDFAPIGSAAWDEINTIAKETLKANLSARRFADVEGPYGINFAAVNLGRLKISDNKSPKDVVYGVNTVLPLVEARINFSLDIWELDNIDRGAKDIALDDLAEAARKMADFEENAVYNGFKDSGIVGLNQVAAKNRINMTLDKDNLVDAISEAQGRMRKEGIASGANLVVNPALWQFLAHVVPGGTLGDTVRRQIKGDIIYSETVDGALLVADREGDVELTTGQDFAIGYHSHDASKVNLFLTESFTFRVITPEAVIGFSLK
ncbi:Linocin_M18 bacteriocin protein [Denitrovibrio acetiphilus DSM 12809]|uniref:Linocin_M18 bacteriocin protein n=1 Tax=Denitrovibrio acetiphilus (strain DSM 12809 / NBRC 114555 / N2460) TaxID=522772 RepID=D4H156_DENA2|nr:family 1 encapsulin nanocompartment shell protein [Denitrovibrio acetiphilus]ADD68719.1 Linocin_M18 bacteriocin protein [Denitrovibrio acetiphilus DSM 12809]